MSMATESPDRQHKSTLTNRNWGRPSHPSHRAALEETQDSIDGISSAPTQMPTLALLQEVGNSGQSEPQLHRPAEIMAAELRKGGGAHKVALIQEVFLEVR